LFKFLNLNYTGEQQNALSLFLDFIHSDE